MSTPKLIDLHVHTDNSPDGHHSTMFICETALLKGIRAVAFTDHFDISEYVERNYAKRSAHSYFEISKARSAFTGKLLVLKGIELGEALFDLSITKTIFEREYDMILGSVHNLRSKPDFKALDYDKIDIAAYLDEYFDELIKLSAWDGCDVIAHLTCPLRYITGHHGISVDLSPYSEKIDTVLENIIKTGKALEINTSELFGSLAMTMPHEDIIRRYRQLGGEYVTVGSDAHYAENVGLGIPQAIELLQKCGFNKLTFFMHREAMQIEI